ncbi:DUF507 family protein [Helicobacter marmotae]|uniref:DUF507 domain-containing protein n=1 Tax=Helicobacter marmotae TaxID=152490 RepID=A0A3D8I7L0_9HELI|nr:DUF507 family protein [Helicobacter marmotae]RDU61139.1 DUF507 domain-containing protein [Helicobacter marmotae]
MKLKMQHAPYIANKISIDIGNSPQIEILAPIEQIAQNALEVLGANIQKELHIDEKVREILEERSDEIEDFGMDERELFRMCKRQVAREEGFYLAWEERCSDVSHQILNALQPLIQFNISETIVKNIIFKAINEYSKIYDKAEEVVIEKLKRYKRKLVYGTEEYEIVFSKLYEEELRKRGLL